MDKIEKIKSLLNKNIERKPTFGTDPNEPWSVRAGITESEGNLLDRYLNSRGINPKFISKYTRISHAKSSAFQQWKRDHMYEETEQLDELSPSTLASYVLKTTSKDPKRAEPRKQAMSKLAKTMAKQPVDPKAPKYLPMGEAKTIQGTALDKFRQAAAERARKHDDIERAMKARHAAGKEDMKGSIDRLQAQLNKEESINEVLATHIANKFHGSGIDEAAGVSKETETKFHKKLDKLVHSTFGKRKDEMKMKEEKEQIDEISKSTLASYKDKSMASLKNAKTNRDAAEPGKNMSKGFADLHAKSDAIAKKRVKGLTGYMQRKQGMKPTSEDVFQDTQAATQTAFDMGTQADDREPVYSKKKEMSKSARMIKALYKKHKMVKEELYDHEKEDKSVASYGKKPKVEKQEVYNDDQAAMVLSGGKTMTGQTRDTLEIDPVLRKPNKPDNKQQINKQQTQG